MRKGVARFSGFDDVGESGGAAVDGVARLGIVDRKVEEFGAAGDAQLVENAEEIILDGVRAEVELGDFAIGDDRGGNESPGVGAGGEQFDALVIGGEMRGGASEGLEG